MATPRYVDDGNWRLKTPMSLVPELPFANKGDVQSFVMRATYRQDKEAYRRPSPMQQQRFDLGTGYLVDAPPARDIGNGLFEFEEVYASLPVNRIEPEAVQYTDQLLVSTSGSPPTYEIEEYSYLRAGYIAYEYSLNAPLPPLIKYRAFVRGKGTQLTSQGRYPSYTLPTRPGYRIAEDSTIEQYMGRIFVRITPFAYWPAERENR